jgi:hypothetical protein
MPETFVVSENVGEGLRASGEVFRLDEPNANARKERGRPGDMVI